MAHAVITGGAGSGVTEPENSSGFTTDLAMVRLI